MNDWTVGSFLFWLAAAILVPAIIVHFTIGKNGGHRLFEKDDLSKDEIRNLPLEMLRKRTRWNLRGSAAAFFAVAFVMVLYPLGSLIGLPINIFGISDEKLIFYTAAILVLAITLGPAVYRKWRDR
ncbi:MAG: hypothetical protein EG825_05730 [Rhodocyclaceae bacterium]|nr:hypothetical protein [Rhodocyclaceae bacterium]